MRQRGQDFLAALNSTALMGSRLEDAVRKMLMPEVRGRLVLSSWFRPDFVDAKFSSGHGWLDQTPNVRDGLAKLGLLEHVGDGRRTNYMASTAFQEYRFGAILDGFSWARNAARMLSLDLTPFLAETGLQFWYYEGLQPWKEYVPLGAGLDAEEVYIKVLWARERHASAREIARASAAFAERWYSATMQLSYLHAALVRYARLVYPKES